jgi:signal transduction histidine kinase/HAMP domain-containing protein
VRRFPALSLGTKLNLALLVFLLLLGAATSGIIIYGFNRTQNSAHDRSNEALEEQGKLALQAFVGGISAIGSLQFEAAGEAGRRAALFIDAPSPGTRPDTVDTSALLVSAAGHHYDPDPARVADLVVISGVDPSATEVRDDIAFSAPLNVVFPIVLQSFEGDVGGGDFDPIAIVFISTNGVTRYYPPTGIHNVLPADADFSERMTQIGPANNPERRTVWTPPYEDGGGQGQIITARTPVYDGDTFRGSLEVDISIARLIDQISGIRPTPRGFAFYVDTNGALLHTEEFDLLRSEADSNPQLASILASMRLAENRFPVPVETLELDGEQFFIAYVPAAIPGGSIAVAAPVSDVTAQAATITAGIDDEGERTFVAMLAAMGALFVVGLAGAGYLNRRVILKPIGKLVGATHAVAGGDFTTTVELDRQDELGTLADSFNTMVAQLQESERVLEQRVETRTRELGALLEMSRSLSSSLDLERVLDSILDHLKALVNCAGASVLLREADDLVQLAVRRPAYVEPVDARAARSAAESYSLIWRTIERGEEVMIDDVRGSSALATAYRAHVRHDLALTPLRYIRAWAAVPLVVRDNVIGMLAMAHEQPGGFAARDLELARAVASQAAVAIDNAGLYATSRRQARETEALLRADEELFRSLALGTVLQALVDVAVDVLGVDKSIVLLHEGDIDVVRATRNFDPANVADFNRTLAMMPHQEPPPEGRQPQVYNDVSDAPGFIAEALGRENIVSHVALPVRDAKRMLGVFGVSFITRHEFSEDEKRLYGALADRAAVAIQNAELFEKAQHAASLEERQRLARELHDSVSQALYGIVLGARTARLRVGDNPERAAEPIDYVTQLAEAGLAEMRALIFELRPESLENEGLVAAIEKQVASTRARHQLAIEADLTGEPDCQLEVKEALYRITQEALNNVVKHAHATNVTVRLAKEDGAVVLTVTDNGKGFDAAASFPGHIGLLSMPERAEKLGGIVVVESAPGSGTRVAARIPL